MNDQVHINHFQDHPDFQSFGKLEYSSKNVLNILKISSYQKILNPELIVNFHKISLRLDIVHTYL